MLVLVYVVTIVAFCILVWAVAYMLSPLVWLYRTISKERILRWTHPVMVFPFVFAAFISMDLTRFVWRKMEYDAGWLLIGILIVIHLVFGSAKGASMANQTQAFGTVFGLVIYAIAMTMGY